jgi:hypothetical protein
MTAQGSPGTRTLVGWERTRCPKQPVDARFSHRHVQEKIFLLSKKEREDFDVSSLTQRRSTPDGSASLTGVTGERNVQALSAGAYRPRLVAGRSPNQAQVVRVSLLGCLYGLSR